MMKTPGSRPRSKQRIQGLLLSAAMAGAACGSPPVAGEGEEAPTVPAASADMSVDPRGGAPAPQAPESASLLFAADMGASCSDVRVDAPLSKRPVDIIFVIDNSGSMTEEIVAVQNNINTSFADIMSRSGMDYRVIMVSGHGSATATQSICVSQPLSTVSCSPVPAQPGNNPPRFYHYSIEIESLDSFRRLLDSYNGTLRDKFGLAPMGWSQWLRTDAFKVFVEITDDDSDLDEVAFETQLLAKLPKHFGDVTNRNYVFHSINGVRENSPATKAWGPADPLQTTKCAVGGFAVNPGLRYQRLSIRTGGLRFPICQFASFSTVFNEIASGVISGSKVVCNLPLPTPPPGEKLDRSSILLEYTPAGATSPTLFEQVGDITSCRADKFYIDSDRIILCPDACTTVQKDSGAKMQVVFDCEVVTRPNGSACATSAECKSGFCTDGVCCDGACGGGSDGDCQVCSRAKGASADGTCTPLGAGTTCRAAAGSCDVAESCDGTSLACPGDSQKSAGTVCRAATGACDTSEVCSGTSALCPADTLVAGGTVCRAAAGGCDAPEVCSGTSAQCPSDSLVAANTVCRPATGGCDAPEVCSGTSALCPSDSLLAAGTVCRDLAGPCDVAEVCSGTSAACPADKLRSTSTTCRAAVGPCDTADKCTGKSALCPEDKFKSNTTVCRASAGSCDLAEFCSGTGSACPADQYKPVIAVCRPAAGACDLADYCTGASPACPPDDLVPGGTVCRGAVSSCDQDEICSGTQAACPADAPKPDGTACTGGTCKAGMCI